ncbi:MAG: hypothetical protein BCS36_03680 [Desulfovibrio sp. MES5]|nr:MAG: hypothetical protein BCS36_03680 [Desulfovibrio sp. MES5]
MSHTWFPVWTPLVDGPVTHLEEKQEPSLKASFIHPKRYNFFEGSIAVMQFLSNNIMVLG